MDTIRATTGIPTLINRVERINRGLVLALASLEHFTDGEFNDFLSDTPINCVDVVDAVRAELTSAIEALYWIQQLPSEVLRTPTPTADQSGATWQLVDPAGEPREVVR